MQFITIKPNEKTKRTLTKVFSIIFVVLILSLSIIIPVQEAKVVPQKTPTKVVSQTEKKKITKEELISRIKKYSIRNKSLKSDLNTENITYIIDNNNDVLTAEKTNEILASFEKYKRVRPNLLNNTEYEMEDLMGNAQGTYSCCSEDDNLVCTLTLYKNFIRYEVIKEEGKVITSDYVLTT